MSTTESAPLPRLGEVFFDVRSKARSLRISWYSDTGVAVLSIWQGGTCTGSFRLPMDNTDPDGRGPAPWAEASGPRAGKGRASRAVRCRRAGPQPGTPRRAGALRRARPRWPCGCLPGLAHSQGRGPMARARAGRAQEPGYPAAPPGGYGTGPARTYRGEPGDYPIDPLDPAYPVPAAGYPEDAGRRVLPPPRAGARPGSGLPRGAGVPGRPGHRRLPPGRSGGLPGRARHRRLPQRPVPAATAASRAAFPARRAPPGTREKPAAGEYRDEDEHGGGYRDPGYPDVPGTGDYRAAPVRQPPRARRAAGPG